MICKISDVIDKEIKGIWGYEPKTTDEVTPVIKTNNMTYEGNINYDDLTLRYIPKEKLLDSYLSTGDLLIEKSGGTKYHSVGYINFFEGENNKYVCNNFVLALRPNKALVKPKFLFYQIKFKYESNQFSDCYNKTTGIQNLQVKSYISKNIKCPDIITQSHQTHSLDRICSCIHKKKEQIDFLDSLVKSRFIEMFPEWDLSEERHGWKSLGEISKIYTGTTPSTTEKSYWNGNIPWVTPAELSDNDYIIQNTERHISEKGKASKSLALMPKNTVLLSTRAPIGKVAITGVEMCCNQGFKNFSCNNTLNSTYLYCLLKLNNEWLQSQGTGTTFKEISKSKVEKIKICVPAIQKQNSFELFYKQIDKSKFIVQKQIKDLQELLDSKMDEYFGGTEE